MAGVRIGSRWGSGMLTRREALVVVAALPLVALVGAGTATLSGQFGAAKVIWVLLVLVGAVMSLSDLRIAVAVLVFALAFPFRTKLLFGVEVHTTHFLLIVVAAMGLIELSLGRRVAPRGLSVAALVITAGAVIGSVAGPDTSGALFRGANGLFLPLVVMVVMAAVIEPDRDLARLVVISAAALAGAGMVALAQAAGQAPSIFPRFEQSRVNGLFLHPNILGGYLAANILLLLGVAASAWRRFSLAALVFLPALLIGLAGMIVTQSRGALVALAAGVAVLLVAMAFQRQAVAVLGVVLVAVLALAVAIPSVPESQRAQLLQRFQKLTQPQAETGRRLVYKAAFQTIRDYPLTGVGPLTFREMINSRSTVPGLEHGLGHAHNIELEAFLSLGPLGLLAFAGLWIGTVVRLLRAIRRRPGEQRDPLIVGWAIGALAALTSIFVQGLADMVFWQIEMLVLVLLLFASAYAIDARRPSASA
jgi:O-antigen ligase